MSGTLLQEILVEPPPGIATFTPRDVGVDRFGRMHMVARHDGFSGNLSLCTYTGAGWSHVTVPDWSQQGVTYYGGMGVNDDCLFYADQKFGSDDTEGILRFPLDDLSNYTHFPVGNFHTVTVGLNGLLYAADRDGNCWVFHPETMQKVADLGRGILNRGRSVVDLCVAANGDIFTIDLGNDVRHFDPFGNLLAQLDDVGPCGDIEILADGTLIIGLADQNVLVGTTVLAGFATFATNEADDPAAWIRNHLCFTPYAALAAPGVPRTAIDGIAVSGNAVDVFFRRAPGVAYELWGSDDLLDWDPLPVAASGTGGDGVFHAGPKGDSPQRYFRIVSGFESL